jgi:hypothetical protein
MAHCLIYQELAFPVVHHLMDLYRKPAILQLANLHWLNLCIQHSPLPRPVITYALMPMDVAAFPTVRPLYILGHARQHGIQLPSVEVAVCSLQDFDLMFHGVLASGYSGWSEVIRQMSGRLR